ncbi:cell division protein FtsA [Dinoroseobacter sp. S76]|uniref:cell division protein FtsA n=1 Tax=Dinoroseobacter sp. S76 TaxID=3415124 RepID=UPI003C7DC3C3
MRDLYSAQRAMRNMRQVAMQRGVVAVLDIGTWKVACLVLKFDGPEPDSENDGVGTMAGQSRFRVIGASHTRSRGIRFGEIDGMVEAERAIRTALQGAQKMAQVRVDHVIASFSGAEPRSYGVSGQVEIAGEAVSEQDIAQVLARSNLPEFGDTREVLHAQPVNFALDHRSGLNDPRGQIGNRLVADMHVLTVEQAAIQNLLYAVKRCDLELAGLASSSYVSGVSALVEDERELGAACIDLGAGSTGVSIFLKKHMIYADSVRLGGEHITSDISKGLSISHSFAERLKTLYGGVLATGMDDREQIEITGETGDWEHDRRTVSRSELIGIIRPRVEEILEDVRDRLVAAGFEQLPSQQIVLTGGGSQLQGLDGLAAKILGPQVRVGRPLRVRGLPQSTCGPEFASVVGLCLHAAHPQDEWWDFEMTHDRYPARSIKRAVRWVRDNW